MVKSNGTMVFRNSIIFILMQEESRASGTKLIPWVIKIILTRAGERLIILIKGIN